MDVGQGARRRPLVGGGPDNGPSAGPGGLVGWWAAHSAWGAAGEVLLPTEGSRAWGRHPSPVAHEERAFPRTPRAALTGQQQNQWLSRAGSLSGRTTAPPTRTHTWQRSRVQTSLGRKLPGLRSRERGREGNAGAGGAGAAGASCVDCRGSPGAVARGCDPGMSPVASPGGCRK